MTESKGIKPKLTLSDLYAEDVVYSARPSYISNPWLEPEEHQSNFLTGRELLISIGTSISTRRHAETVARLTF